MTSAAGISTADTRVPGGPTFFISYCVDDKKFVFDICSVLAPYFGRKNMFLYEEHPGPAQDFLKQMMDEVAARDGVIVFVGRRYGPYQFIELAAACKGDKPIWVVGIGGQESMSAFDEFIKVHAGTRPIGVDSYSHYVHQIPPAIERCAHDLMNKIREWWQSGFQAEWKKWDDTILLNGLPSVPQLFDYEKTIIDFYCAKQLREDDRRGAIQQSSGAAQRRADGLRKRWPADKIERLLNSGVPAQWPEVYRYPVWRENHLDPTVAGDFRASTDDGEALVRAAALMGLDPPGAQPTFPEAGPRRRLAFPQPRSSRQLNVAVLVAGGIAPGINAVIDALVQRHHAYQKADADAGKGYQLRICGVKNGFLAISGKNPHLTPHLVELVPHTSPNDPRQGTVEYATRGGSMLGTSRDHELLHPETRYSRLDQIAEALSRPEQMFDMLYVICGDGGMKAAHALWHLANRRRPPERRLSVVTVPKTMDNDILWVWQSFGFLSAVDESRKIVETLHTEVRSNPRLGIVQLFGSDSGFVVSHAVLASAAGHATLALIPEIRFSALGVARYLKRALWRSTRLYGPTAPIDEKFPHGLVVLAENAVPLDALECLGLRPPPPPSPPSPDLEPVYSELRRQMEHAGTKFQLSTKETREITAFVDRLKNGKPFEGQTSDTIRKIGLRIMAETLPFLLRQNLKLDDAIPWEEPDWSKLRVVCSEPRHLVRALEPSTSDIINGQRLGLLAVDAAMAGYTDCMISQWLTEFTIVPSDLVVLGRKRIPPQGMFWKSVMSKTGQDPDLVAPYPQPTTPA